MYYVNVLIKSWTSIDLYSKFEIKFLEKYKKFNFPINNDK